MREARWSRPARRPDQVVSSRLANARAPAHPLWQASQCTPAQYAAANCPAAHCPAAQFPATHCPAAQCPAACAGPLPIRALRCATLPIRVLGVQPCLLAYFGAHPCPFAHWCLYPCLFVYWEVRGMRKVRTSSLGLMLTEGAPRPAGEQRPLPPVVRCDEGETGLLS